MTSRWSAATFRVRGDVLEVHAVDTKQVTRVEMFGDTVERITIIDPLTGEVLEEPEADGHLPGEPLRLAAGEESSRRWRRSRRSCRSAMTGSSRAGNCWRRSASCSARATTWR